MEIIWLDQDGILAIHESQIGEHGGIHGIRSPELLDSALARPQNIAAYAEGEVSVCELAAAYAYGLAKNHPFFDGNKRTAYVAAELFLELNGHGVLATDEQAIEAMLQLAGGEMSEDAFAQWLRDNLGPPHNPN